MGSWDTTFTGNAMVSRLETFCGGRGRCRNCKRFQLNKISLKSISKNFQIFEIDFIETQQLVWTLVPAKGFVNLLLSILNITFLQIQSKKLSSNALINSNEPIFELSCLKWLILNSTAF